MDSELDRVGVLELINEHVVKAWRDGRLALLEPALNGGEVQDVLLVEITLPSLLQRDQVIGQPWLTGGHLDAVELPSRAAARQPGLGVLAEQGSKKADPLE